MKGTTGCFLLVLHKTSYKNGKLIWVRLGVFGTIFCNEISSALPLLSEEFLTGPVVASREMPNTQVTPEFTDMTRVVFFGLKKCNSWILFARPGIICSAISVALEHNSGHIARGNCRVELFAL